jgi:DNA-binding transcriptional MerR regulator
MAKNKDFLKIGQLARLANVLPSTIHFYTQEGLLKPVGRSRGGYRYYDKEKSLRIMNRIDSLQVKKRLTIQEIKKVL